MGAWRSKFESKRTELQRGRYEFINSLIQKDGDDNAFEDSVETEENDDSGCSVVNPKDYDFPFENLVFEGGGSKGLAYCGAVQYLEEVGVMPQIKRFAGTSAGAMMAAMLAVGYTSSDIKQLMGGKMEDILLDGRYLTNMRNIFWNFGFHPGGRIYDWFGEKFRQRTGSADITFEEVRRKYGRELCVVVTNLNMMRTEYCHPKTTPDMPVRLALRMSMSIPGLFTVKRYIMHGNQDMFLDGGILCNYPIHCFDGWFLSMAKGDNFIKRFQLPVDHPTMNENMFKEDKLNLKTLGLLLYSDTERDFLRSAIEGRRGKEILPAKPEKETKLYKKWKEKQLDCKKMEQVHEKLAEATSAFFKVLDKYCSDTDVIQRKHIEAALRDKDFSKSQTDILFGKGAGLQDVCDCLDHNRDGKIDYSELTTFIGGLGIHLQNRSFDYRRRDIDNLFSFVHCLESTLLVNTKKISVKPTDVERTVGINTGHILATNFALEKEDKEFLMKRGYNACRVFLQQFVESNQLEPKRNREGQNPDTAASS